VIAAGVFCHPQIALVVVGDAIMARGMLKPLTSEMSQNA